VKILEDIAKQFAVSKPVFVAEMHDEGEAVYFVVNSIPAYDADSFEDPVTKMIARRFSQSFNANERRFVRTTHTGGVYYDIVDSISSFYEEHSQLKNPKQSRLYKWLRSVNYDHTAAEGFIALYRYIAKHDTGIRCSPDVIANTLAILEMMREKYETKQ
jgi:hypothetical protein